MLFLISLIMEKLNKNQTKNTIMADFMNKDNLGKLFFALSIIFLVYLLVTPLNHLMCQIDEYFTRTVLLLPLSDIITVTAHDVHPPLFYVMGKAVIELSKIFGIDYFFSLKLLSILAYVLVLIVSFTKIRKDYGWLTAGIFVFALAMMNEYSRYCLIGRMYTWAVLFILLAFLSFREIIIGEGNRKSWILLTLFSTLAAYTHYFAAITAICIYLGLLIYIVMNRKSELKNWIISSIAVIVLYLPWLPIFINQSMQVKESFWITDVTLEKAILFFGYYGFNGTVLMGIISILFLIAFIIIFKKESKIFDKKEKFIISSGFGVYLGTIALGIIISVLFTPIMDARYIMPAAGVLWLTLSIVLGKIEDKKLFIISLALVLLLIASGIGNTIYTYEKDYHNGIIQKEYFDNITQDDNSVLIVPTRKDICYFLSYSNETDMYCLNASDVFGVEMDRLHESYDFKNLNLEEIDGFIANNTDKNIYVAYWDEPDINSPLEIMDQEVLLYFTKVDMEKLNSTF